MQRYAPKSCDIAIIGCGPAGLSAAINARLRNKRVVVMGSAECAPGLTASPLIENYLGLPGAAGAELLHRFLDHARRSGAELLETQADSVTPTTNGFELDTHAGTLSAQAIIVTAGNVQTAYLPGERELVGHGVHYCATCDGPLYRGKSVAIIAFTPAAEAEANDLASICRRVTYLPQYGGPLHLQRQIQAVPLRPQAIDHTGRRLTIRLEGTVVHGNPDRNAKAPTDTILADAVFIVREEPPLDTLLPGLQLFGNAVQVDRSMATNIPGVWAAGDCTGRPHQVAKGVGEGQVAALSAARWLDLQTLRARGETPAQLKYEVWGNRGIPSPGPQPIPGPQPDPRYPDD